MKRHTAHQKVFCKFFESLNLRDEVKLERFGNPGFNTADFRFVLESSYIHIILYFNAWHTSHYYTAGCYVYFVTRDRREDVLIRSVGVEDLYYFWTRCAEILKCDYSLNLSDFIKQPDTI